MKQTEYNIAITTLNNKLMNREISRDDYEKEYEKLMGIVMNTTKGRKIV